MSEGVLSVRRTVEEITRKTAEATGAKATLNEKAPKTKKSRRVITLEPIAIQAFKDRMKKADDLGFTQDLVPFVFCNTIGTRIRANGFNKRCWYPIREEMGLKHVKFHDLRHTQASLMLYSGVDAKVIQERLGHADISTTLNMYAHLMQDAQVEATDKLSEMMTRKQPKPSI